MATKKTPSYSVKEILKTLLLIIGIFAFRSTFASIYVVPSGSMEPTILPGDHILTLKSAYHFRVPFTHLELSSFTQPKRGDIIVFDYPKDPSINYVKRLIGLPGDVIEVQDGKIRVNGVSTLTENQDHSLSTYFENLGGAHYQVQRLPHVADPRAYQIVVPEHQYFFMGDNRDNSSDSRFWGFVPEENLEGKALAVLWSMNTKDHLIPDFRFERTGNKL